MEPVTHFLTGACLARAGLNRRAAYATAAMALAAEFPDIDTLWGLDGPIASFQHHRGWTHTFLGLPVEAGVLLLVFYGVEQWRGTRRKRNGPDGTQAAAMQAAPPRWGVLYLLILLALLSHILLDYTNNYGVRPFFPFSPRWHAASIVFIFDPLIFLLLVVGLAAPGLFSMIRQEVGARKSAYSARGWPAAALAAIVLLWGVRTFEHRKALDLASAQTKFAPSTAVPVPQEDTLATQAAPLTSGQVLRPVSALANPDPFSIFRWYTVTDFGPEYVLGTANTSNMALSEEEVLAKPELSPSIRAAKESRLGQIYLDWAKAPLVTESRQDAASSPGGAVVSFRDLRFAGDVPLLHRSGKTPLTGVVLLDASGAVQGEGMDGRIER